MHGQLLSAPRGPRITGAINSRRDGDSARSFNLNLVEIEKPLVVTFIPLTSITSIRKSTLMRCENSERRDGMMDSRMNHCSGVFFVIFC